MNYCKILLCVLCCFQLVSGITVSDAESKVVDLGKGIASSFGACFKENTYTMQAWNDAPISMTFQLQEVVNVQGANFHGDIAASAKLEPYTWQQFPKKVVCHAIIRIDPSDGAFNDSRWANTWSGIKQLGTSGFISSGTNSMFQRPIDIDPKDKNIYYYHAYALPDGPEGEFLGPGFYGSPSGTSPEFNGVFFNHLASPDPASLTFTKNGTTYKNISLEQNTFSLLDSDESYKNSIRPPNDDTKRSFDFAFSKGQTPSIPIHAQVLAQSFTDKSTNTTQTFPYTCTYEIFGSTDNPLVCQQGFNMGNYNQPGILNIAEATSLLNTELSKPSTTLSTAISAAAEQIEVQPIRDLNPISCSFWCQSAQQAQEAQKITQDASITFYNLSEQVWATYVTKDQNITQKLIPGTVTPLHIIRPLPSEETANLFIFSLNTNDDQKAQAFLNYIAQNPNTIKTILPDEIPDPLDSKTNLADILNPTLNNFITDASSGVTGALLLADTFIPYSGGFNSLRYYQIPPAILRIDDTFMGLITPYLDTKKLSKEDQQKVLLAKMPQWLSEFQTNKLTITNLDQINLGSLTANAGILQALVPDLTAFLKTNGLAKLFDSNGFTDMGLRAFYFILLGPASFNKPPIIRQAGSCTYLQEGSDELDKFLKNNWPTAN